MIIQVIASTPSDCTQINESKAHRIQLVSALEVGGLTPSSGLIRKCLEVAGQTPINVMIRPHSYSFVYSLDELECMISDIELCKDYKVNGVVYGALKPDNTIDVPALQALLAASQNLQVTFHKAFDETPDLIQSLQILTKYKQITTILTQGGKLPIAENLPLLQNIVEKKQDKIILLGGGLTSKNIADISTKFGEKCEYHFGGAMRKQNRVRAEQINDIVSLFKS